MSPIETVWYVVVAFSCLFAMADWRRALYLGILIDVLRDPIRKLAPAQSVLITLSGAGVWLLIVLVATLSQSNQVTGLYRRYPRLKTALQLIIFALIPAAAISCISYQGGWIIAGIGGSSFVVPLLGVFAGYILVRQEADIRRLFSFYIVVNSVMLVSVLFEYAGIDVPALGGIDYHWIRYHEDSVIDLMSGWYRSPDVMGLHAAMVIMFSILLAIRGSDHAVWAWVPLALWATFCTFVSGRRKMMGIPLVFIVTFLVFGIAYRLTKMNRLVGILFIGLLMSIAVSLMIWSPDQAEEHSEYAATLITQGVQRSNDIVFGSVLGTLQQSGFIGEGLGTATQGNYYAGVVTPTRAGWQEDSISRLILELGVPGTILLGISAILLLGTIRRAIRYTPRNSDQAILLIGLISIVAGNAASFVISHQQFSGDPVCSLLVTLIVGMILKVPGLVPRMQSRQPNRTATEPAARLLAVTGASSADDAGEQ